MYLIILHIIHQYIALKNCALTSFVHVTLC